MADKNRTFPRDINMGFVYLGQILYHCNLGFTHVLHTGICLCVLETLP